MIVIILQNIGLKEDIYLNCELNYHIIMKALITNFSYYGLH